MDKSVEDFGENIGEEEWTQPPLLESIGGKFTNLKAEELERYIKKELVNLDISDFTENMRHYRRVHNTEVNLASQDLCFVTGEDLLRLSNSIFAQYLVKNFLPIEKSKKESEVVNLLFIQTMLRCIYRELESIPWESDYLDQYLRNVSRYNNPKNLRIELDKERVGDCVVDTRGKGVKYYVTNSHSGIYNISAIGWDQSEFMVDSKSRIPEIWGSADWLDGKEYSKEQLVTLIKKIANEIRLYRLWKQGRQNGE